MILKGKIKPGATFKTTKQVWKLRTAQSFLKNVLTEVPDNDCDDLQNIKACIQIMDAVIGRQIG